MPIKLLELFLKHRDKLKFLGGAGAGGIVVMVVLALHSDIKVELTKAEARSRSYADTKLLHTQEVLSRDILHLRDGQQLIIEGLRKLDDRIYQLNKTKGK